ncbi:hypothetical protein L873DRAFT_769309 [Choiromyces venosus 120613-1]|uniref:Uncharacterized protein n=1 Tax=Choiromyces venosus 120613-1 TaxID=1336337 RepID=A0A3N4JWG5_9PEZI|nr:hypothetical protein L873DRAFT_769309 [Choiromyces venosus 120613-1]
MHNYLRFYGGISYFSLHLFHFSWFYSFFLDSCYFRFPMIYLRFFDSIIYHSIPFPFNALVSVCFFYFFNLFFLFNYLIGCATIVEAPIGFDINSFYCSSIFFSFYVIVFLLSVYFFISSSLPFLVCILFLFLLFEFILLQWTFYYLNFYNSLSRYNYLNWWVTMVVVCIDFYSNLFSYFPFFFFFLLSFSFFPLFLFSPFPPSPSGFLLFSYLWYSYFYFIFLCLLFFCFPSFSVICFVICCLVGFAFLVWI